MTEKQKEIARKLGLNPEDFEPKKNPTTIEDVVEAMNTLLDIVLKDEE